jgi:hypothetical protein
MRNRFYRKVSLLSYIGGGYDPAMKSPSKSLSVAGPAILLALFAAGGLVGRALSLPLPDALVGLALVLLGLRVGVTIAALQEAPPEAPARPAGPAADAHQPALRAAG